MLTVWVAINDGGAGFASFRHILELQPHLVKLDVGLVRGIDADPARQALVAGMRYFATKTRVPDVAVRPHRPARAAASTTQSAR